MYQNVSNSEFKQLMNDNPDATLLDVRTPGEWNSGIIPGSKLINLMDPAFGMKVAGFDKEQPVLIYCRSGNRSAYACHMMAQMGFKKLYNHAPGIIGWDEPVVKPQVL
jgi:rhodanese-related sulfurtransferase